MRLRRHCPLLAVLPRISSSHRSSPRAESSSPSGRPADRTPVPLRGVQGRHALKVDAAPRRARSRYRQGPHSWEPLGHCSESSWRSTNRGECAPAQAVPGEPVRQTGRIVHVAAPRACAPLALHFVGNGGTGRLRSRRYGILGMKREDRQDVESRAIGTSGCVGGI